MSFKVTNILVVCTGNICRSPLAEQLIASQLSNTLEMHFSVSSAGTHATEGQALHPKTQVSMQILGQNPNKHSAQKLNQGLIEWADLVLTATADHRAEVARLLPRAARFSFTILELEAIASRFGQLMLDMPAEAKPLTFARKIELAARFRGSVGLRASQLDIADPIAGSQQDFDIVASQTQRATQTITDWIVSK